MNSFSNFFKWARWHYGHHLKGLLFEGHSKRYRKQLRALHIRSLIGNPFKKYRVRQRQAEILRKLRKIDNGPGESQ